MAFSTRIRPRRSNAFRNPWINHALWAAAKLTVYTLTSRNVWYQVPPFPLRRFAARDPVSQTFLSLFQWQSIHGAVLQFVPSGLAQVLAPARWTNRKQALPERSKHCSARAVRHLDDRVGSCRIAVVLGDYIPMSVSGVRSAMVVRRPVTLSRKVERVL